MLRKQGKIGCDADKSYIIDLSHDFEQVLTQENIKAWFHRQGLD